MTAICAGSEYDQLAPYYDRFTAHPGYANWVRRIEALARRHGVPGAEALDVACGTGSSFLPLLDLGYRVTGVDSSPAMLAEARAKTGGRVPLHCFGVPDMPVLGSFALITWLNDACNCILDGAALERALERIAANLAPGGVLAFDANTLATYRGFFAERHTRSGDELEFVWNGQGLADGLARGVIEVFEAPRNGHPPLVSAPQVQAHHPHARIAAAVEAAGLSLAAVVGSDPEGHLADPPSDEHPKWIYVATKPEHRFDERGDHAQGQAAREAGDAGARLHEARIDGGGARAAGGPGAKPLAAPRLKSTVDVRRAPDGRLLVLRADVTGRDLELEGDTRWIEALLGLLDGRSRDELGRALAVRGLAADGDLVDGALAELEAAGLLEDAAADAVLDDYSRERWSRQLAYFADLADPGDAPFAQRRLQSATVCVLGVGGLGSWTAYALASAGVGRLRLVDGDTLELSNLNRQVLYEERELGRPKAELACERLRAFSPRAVAEPVCRRLDSEAAVAEAIEGATFVVDAADWPPVQIDRWVNAAATAAGIPFLAMSQHPPRVRIGPLYVPGQTGCHACVEASFRRRFADFDALAAAAPPPTSAAAFGPACAAVGALAAAEVVHYLTGLVPPPTVGQSVTIDLRDLSAERQPVVREPGCPVCG